MKTISKLFNHKLMKTRQLLFLVAAVLSIVLTSCKYDFVVDPDDTIDPNVPIKFATEIVPIFNQFNCISCHKTGATAPDLTADKAYAAIVPALIDTAEPEASIIYWFAHPDSETHKWSKLNKSKAALILEWIKQGAKNN